MDRPTVDPAEQKAQQRQFWSSVASVWRERWPMIEAGSQPVSDRLVVLADVQPGLHVLDVATGIGEPAATAARAVGPGGAVLAIDQAPQMLALARERLAELGLSNVELREGDVESIVLPELEFDAILCRWGLMFLSDLHGTLARLRAALKPGGRLAAATWGPPPQVPMMSLPWAVLARELGVPPDAAQRPQAQAQQGQTQGPFTLSDRTQLEDALRAAGYSDVTSETIVATARFPSAADFVSFTLTMAGPQRELIERQPPDRQAQLRRALEDAGRQYAQPDGTVRFENLALLVAGQR